MKETFSTSSQTLMALLPSCFDPRSGYCNKSKTFHSLRAAVPLPPLSVPLSFPAFAFSLLPSPLPSHPALLDAFTGKTISYPDFISSVRSLAANLQHHAAISKGDVAFILLPTGIDVPILYLALLSLGVVLSPANPASTPSEIARLVNLSKSSLAFATSFTAHKLPDNLPTILLDSLQFQSFLRSDQNSNASTSVEIFQSDIAVIQYSSGTTGRIKAAALPHRAFIAMSAGFHALRPGRLEVTLLCAPLFHSFGFFFILKSLALGESTVLPSLRMNRITGILEVVERHKVTLLMVPPPLVVAMTKLEVMKYDLDALEMVMCGGAPLSIAAAKRFYKRFAQVLLAQGYGSTEGGGISRMIGPEECNRLKSAGRLVENAQVKIVDPNTGKALSVGQTGELWLKSPACMTGYIGDDEANAAAFDSDGWLRTGDLCYIDEDGFVYVVDRLKELIKYKAYQVPPAELEHVLHSHPEVVDAAVMPIPHEEVGQIPAALVVRREGSTLSETEVIDYVAKQVAPYKKIRRVLFVNRIPKSPSGKILRRELANHMLCSSVSRL
ncbi:4-coumarate--CoA ligase-like 4 [Rhynchospora pubera]|uniref:4-coumarate--CoA ligase n=1 Tax=Rhynchospora pubera TaxID=906938 RepID=A0AAV8HN91_9POAL|nr:4-coumarate--CoA ligase-like 4 [Rhynchospora pubera]